jgi:hypothetical protein
MTVIQTTLETCRGVRLVTPSLESDKARLFLLSLYSTRHLIEMDLADCVDENVKLHLQDCFTEMTKAIYKQGGAL